MAILGLGHPRHCRNVVWPPSGISRFKAADKVVPPQVEVKAGWATARTTDLNLPWRRDPQLIEHDSKGATKQLRPNREEV